MDTTDFVELLPIFCLVPLLLVGGILAVHWGIHLFFSTNKQTLELEQLRLQNQGLQLQNARAKLDLPLVPVYNGVHKMFVARALLNDAQIATELTARAIETTRRKPLDELNHLTYAPRIAGADAQADADLASAMDSIDSLLDRSGGELDMHTGAVNGNGKH